MIPREFHRPRSPPPGRPRRLLQQPPAHPGPSVPRRHRPGAHVPFPLPLHHAHDDGTDDVVPPVRGQHDGIVAPAVAVLPRPRPVCVGPFVEPVPAELLGQGDVLARPPPHTGEPDHHQTCPRRQEGGPRAEAGQDAQQADRCGEDGPMQQDGYGALLSLLGHRVGYQVQGGGAVFGGLARGNGGGEFGYRCGRGDRRLGEKVVGEGADGEGGWCGVGEGGGGEGGHCRGGHLAGAGGVVGAGGEAEVRAESGEECWTDAISIWASLQRKEDDCVLAL